MSASWELLPLNDHASSLPGMYPSAVSASDSPIDKKCLNGSTHLHRVTMPPIDKGVLPFALHPTRAADTPSHDAWEQHYEA